MEGAMKIAAIVRAHIPAIIQYCETTDTSEFARLKDAAFCKAELDINYPFFAAVPQITPDLHARYWSPEFRVCGAQVRITSQWFNPPTSKSTALLVGYLQRRGIPLACEVNKDLDSPLPLDTKIATPFGAPARAPKARYRGNPIGNAQNHLVRHILSRLGEDAFGADDWAGVVAQFGQNCAYCGSSAKLVMDHAIPINRNALGEHRLGNLVPACGPCNAAKAQNDYRTHLKGDTARIAAIEAHMVRHAYTPIGPNPRLQAVIEQAHSELRQLADRYVTIIETILPRNAL